MIRASKSIAEEIESKLDEVVRIAARCKDENRAYTAEEELRVQELNAEIERKKPEFDASKLHESKLKNMAAERGRERIEKQIKESEQGEQRVTTTTQTSKSVFKNSDDAYESGMFLAATLFGSKKAQRYCEDRGLIQNSMVGSDNQRGGFLVPGPLEQTIVELRESFGVFRQEAQVVPMSSDTTVIPKVVGELTSYYVSEMGTIDASSMELTQIRLTARKLATLTAVSSELDEDDVIGVAEMLARSAAYSFALKEDQAGFLGDATSSFGGIQGLSQSLKAGSTVTATGRATFGALTMADFEACIGRCRQWSGSNPKWYISQQGWANSMQRLLNAAGGNDLALLAMGPTKMFMGFPVVISQALPQALTGTTGTLACFFGDLRQGVYMGSRRGVTVAVDPSLYFNQDALAVRATERYDIVCHDLGSATEAGGIVELVFG